jgi:hypothetical protein
MLKSLVMAFAVLYSATASASLSSFDSLGDQRTRTELEKSEQQLQRIVPALDKLIAELRAELLEDETYREQQKKAIEALFPSNDDSGIDPSDLELDLAYLHQMKICDNKLLEARVFRSEWLPRIFALAALDNMQFAPSDSASYGRAERELFSAMVDSFSARSTLANVECASQARAYLRIVSYQTDAAKAFVHLTQLGDAVRQHPTGASIEPILLDRQKTVGQLKSGLETLIGERSLPKNEESHDNIFFALAEGLNEYDEEFKKVVNTSFNPLLHIDIRAGPKVIRQRKCGLPSGVMAAIARSMFMPDWPDAEGVLRAKNDSTKLSAYALADLFDSTMQLSGWNQSMESTEQSRKSMLAVAVWNAYGKAATYQEMEKAARSIVYPKDATSPAYTTIFGHQVLLTSASESWQPNTTRDSWSNEKILSELRAHPAFCTLQENCEK